MSRVLNAVSQNVGAEVQHRLAQVSFLVTFLILALDFGFRLAEYLALQDAWYFESNLCWRHNDCSIYALASILDSTL